MASSSQMTGSRKSPVIWRSTARWPTYDEIAAASPAELRKGPRGGGRDRDQIIGHVIGADTAYARKLGIKRKQPATGDIAAIEELREAIAAVVGTPVRMKLTRATQRLDHALSGPPDRLARPRTRLGDARPGGKLCGGPAGADRPGLIGGHDELAAISRANRVARQTALVNYDQWYASERDW